jgi:hypothetical protein
MENNMTADVKDTGFEPFNQMHLVQDKVQKQTIMKAEREGDFIVKASNT